MKAWSALRHRLGEADDLPDLIEKARDPDEEVRRHARFGLAERLVGRGSWPSAAPRAVSELVIDAVFPDTPDRGGLLDLLARIAGSDAPRVLFKTLAPTDTNGRGVLEALDTRSLELQELTGDEDPSIRASAMRLISIAVPDATLPESDEDPSVEAALAVARGRLDLPFEPKTDHANALHTAFVHKNVDEAALSTALGWIPDPELFPWCAGDLDAFIRKLLSIKHDDRMLAATVFSLSVRQWPDHPRAAERAQIVGAEGFPQPIESVDELSADQKLWLTRCLARPLRRNALEIPGLPPRYEDARRFLGLDPPGLLERETPNGPIWSVLEDDPEAEALQALEVTPAERLELAGLSVFQPYWIEPVDIEVLATLAAAATDAEAAKWAKQFLDALAGLPADERPWEGPKLPRHVNVALLQLHRAGKKVPDGSLVFGDTTERVAAVLDALSDRRSKALGAHLTDPDRPDFQEAEVLAGVLDHLGDDATLVEPVLAALAGLIAQIHHDDDGRAVIRRTVEWVRARDGARFTEWKDLLSMEEGERLDLAMLG